jgi:mRNA interferase MazF
MLTSKITNLLPREFLINEYAKSGLNVQTAVKRGFYTIDQRLVVQSIGFLRDSDSTKLTQSICYWFKFLIVLSRIWLNLLLYK